MADLGIDASHECPYPPCRRRVRRTQFSCPAHWTVLPPAMRRAISSAYGRDWPAHIRAMNAAIDWYREQAAPGGEVAADG